MAAIAEKAAADKEYTLRRAAVLAEVNYSALFLYSQGKPTIGLKSVEKLNRLLGINVVDADTGEFYYHGGDIREAIKRGMSAQRILVKDICEAADIRQPAVTEFLAGRSVVRPAKAEMMLQRLGLSVAVVPTPDRIPRVKGGRRCTFPIGGVVRQAMERQGISASALCKELGLYPSNFGTFLWSGRNMFADGMERVFKRLGIVMCGKDGTKYSDGIRDAVKAELKAQSVTYKELAEAVGCSIGMVSFYLSGRNNTMARKAAAMFDRLGMVVKCK